MRGAVAPGVTSADAVQIAIPLRELGGLRPGQTVRIAGGVGLDATPATMRRQFDAGFIGVAGPTVVGERPVFSGVAIRWPEPPPIRLEATWESEGRLRIRWAAWPGQRYRLEASDDLRSPFQGVEEIEAPPDGEFAEVRVATGGDRRYFRIR